MKITKDFSREFTSTMEVKQGCSLSLTLFGFFIAETSNYVEIGWSRSMLNRGEHTKITIFP